MSAGEEEGIREGVSFCEPPLFEKQIMNTYIYDSSN